jgi:hypothetical protein
MTSPQHHPRKSTSSAEHHYFPKALQKFWRDDHGWVQRLSVDGNVDRSKNGTFGHLRNAHRIKLSKNPTPWDESFEYTFGPADSSIPTVIGEILQVEAPSGVEDEAWPERFAPQWHLEESRKGIAELVASLVVRSPSLRNLIRVGIDDFWDRFGNPPWPKGEMPTHLIAANQRPLLEQYANALASRGKFVVLLSDHSEFVFGDGVLNNFRSGGPVSPSNPRCVVPLTPTVAIAYDCPSQYHVSANFAAVRLTPAEVDEVNWYTQVYSGRHLYFRSQLPADLTAFEIGSHQQLRYHRAPWLDGLMEVVANTWF